MVGTARHVPQYRPRRRAVPAPAVAALSLAVLAPAAVLADLPCGVASLFDFTTLTGSKPSAQAQQEIETTCRDRACSMRDIVEAGERLGIALEGIGGTLDEVAGPGGPAIIHLSDPDHFVVLARLSDEWAQTICLMSTGFPHLAAIRMSSWLRVSGAVVMTGAEVV